ncbi:hypothetical protein F2P56_009241 [Juglans regia]|uniref:Uncharacterized protein LOC108990201 n=2 Tax=Juglans regia TaxID=51240 RepID=A0A2I4EJR0_JUGRE|nr:uncharacterized protein LOC108990201 [Juglans regia]KAF5472530.1 hypothetical protein F2P56_009241 [Juglans regia]
MKRGESGDSSVVSGLEKCWKRLWSLEISGTVKHFLWKASQDVLPTRKNICKKQVLTNPLCMIYKEDEEIVTHVLWRCIVANDIWADNTSLVQKWSVNESEFMELWKRFSECLTEAEQKWVAVAMWRIWLRRKHFMFQGKMMDPRKIIQVEGFIKANWDAAVDEGARRKGIGVIVRDHEGEILASLFVNKPFHSKPVLAECFASCRGDAQVLVKAVNTKGENWLWFGQIVEDIQEMLQRMASIANIVPLIKVVSLWRPDAAKVLSSLSKSWSSDQFSRAPLAKEEKGKKIHDKALKAYEAFDFMYSAFLALSDQRVKMIFELL